MIGKQRPKFNLIIDTNVLTFCDFSLDFERNKEAIRQAVSVTMEQLKTKTAQNTKQRRISALEPCRRASVLLHLLCSLVTSPCWIVLSSNRPPKKLQILPATLCKATPGQAKPSQAKPDQTRPDQTKPDQTRSNQAKPCQTKPAKPYQRVKIPTVAPIKYKYFA